MSKEINFIKMNGAGNDFVVIDARKNDISLSPAQIHTLSARDNVATKGCDQLLILEKSEKDDVFMRIYNADGGQVDACGNATRCIADMLYRELGRLPVTIETNVAILSGIDIVTISNNNKFEKALLTDCILVDMGKPKFYWQDIPLAVPITEAIEKIKLTLASYQKLGKISSINFVNMGNPHLILFLNLENKDTDNPDIYAVDGFLDEIGQKLENTIDIFPKKTNVSVVVPYPEANAFGGYRFMTSTWERGVGYTAACGTAACAILAAFNEYIEPKIRKADVVFNISNQNVMVSLNNNNHILLGGAVEVEFEGVAEI